MKIYSILTVILTSFLLTACNSEPSQDDIYNAFKSVVDKSNASMKAFDSRVSEKDLLRIDYVEGEKNSFTVFVSNELKVKRINMHKNDELKDLFKHEIDVAYHEDLVINGLGFIKIVEKAKINVYINKDVEVFTRDSLI